MIPFDYITEWRATAPWVQDAQVEQDLVLSRALVAIFQAPDLAGFLAFRGGSALYKLHLTPAARYSEDLDFVQTTPGPIGAVLDAVRGALDSWLGMPRRSLKEGGATLTYRMESEGAPALPMRLKIEINSREHFSVFRIERRDFTVDSRWFAGSASIPTYTLDELLGTKLRALYQRRKGRDLFDLWLAQGRAPVDPERVIACFLQYLGHAGLTVSRAEFEANLEAKTADPRFLGDIAPLLSPRCPWDPAAATRYVRDELLARLPGDPWRGGSGGGEAPR
jgi:predicted nucleotidyltransferase component of viral defense system